MFINYPAGMWFTMSLRNGNIGLENIVTKFVRLYSAKIPCLPTHVDNVTSTVVMNLPFPKAISCAETKDVT